MPNYSKSGHANAAGIVAEADGTLPGDYNANGTVDAADYTDTLGGEVEAFTGADGDGDDMIDADDYGVWKSHFGDTAGSGSGSSLFSADTLSPAVPEPAGAWLLICGVIIAKLRRVGRRVKTRS